MVSVLTDQNFKEVVSGSKKPVLVDFWASWCAPCTALGPVLERVSSDFGEEIIFAKINIDDSPVTAQEFSIDRIPAVILFKEGKPVSGFLGVRPEEEIREWILRQTYEEYAKNSGFKVNPDKETVGRLIKGLLNNEAKHGARYCPCRRVTGNKEEDKGKICPCLWHKEEIEKDGHCLCGLFIK
jgi:thioredoxin